MDVINSTATATASVTATTQHEDHIHYQDGDEIQVEWHVGFFFLAYFTAFIGTYAAIRILEHGLWRSEKERLHATSKYKLLECGNHHAEHGDLRRFFSCHSPSTSLPPLLSLVLQSFLATPGFPWPLRWDRARFGRCISLACKPKH